jgi:hypothetical protein
MPAAPLLLAVSLVLQAPTPAGPFTSEAGGFRVALPCVPKEAEQPFNTGVGPVALHSFSVDRDGTTYAATYSDYPETFALADPDRVLEGGIDGGVKGIKGKLLLKRNIALGGHPGREFSATTTGPGGAPLLYRARIYLVGTRLYQVVVCGPEAKVAGEAGDAILRSFALLRPPAPPEPAKPLAAGKAFASPEGRFRVRFPQGPRERVQKVGSPAGPIEVHMFVADLGDVAYFASYNDYSVDPAQLDPEAALESVVQGALAAGKGRLTARRDVRLGDHPGKEYQAALSLPDGRPAASKARVYLVGARLYQVLVVSPEGKEDTKAVDAFLDSFALVKPPTP